VVRHARRNHARDLRRDVGPQHRDFPALRLDEAQQIARIERIGPPLHHFGVLEERRDD
jgi:hypothetical protein